MITNQNELRRLFWAEHPRLSRKKRKDAFGNGMHYPPDTRVTWCDWLDAMARNGQITTEMADKATLD